MSAKPNDFKIGLFVLGGLTIVVAGGLIFGASRLFERKIVQETYVQGDAHGLKQGAPVTLNGVPVGEVTRISFSWNVYHRREPRYVVIEFYVRSHVSPVPPGKGYSERLHNEIARGLRARIATQGVVGASLLALDYLDPAKYPPLSVPWKPHHFYIPSAPGQMSEIMTALDKTMSGLKQVDFKQITEGIATNAEQLLVQLKGTAGRLDQVVAKLQRVQFDQISRTVSTNAEQLLVELQGTANRLDQIMANVQRVNFGSISTNADQVLVELKTTAGHLDQVVQTVDASSLNQTLDNIRHASQELDEAIARFKQYPSGVLFGQPPPPARSVQPSRR